VIQITLPEMSRSVDHNSLREVEGGSLPPTCRLLRQVAVIPLHFPVNWAF